MARRFKAADDAARASAGSDHSIPAGPRVDHAALFPGLRARHDGWTAARTQRFLDVLAHTGCVEDACRVAGMSAVGARRMQAKYPAFAAAWDDALGRAQKGLVAIAYARAVEGRETVIIRKGEEVERRIAPSDALLALLVKRGDLQSGGMMHDPAKILTFDEYQAGWRFMHDGSKYEQEDPVKASESFRARLALMRERMIHYAEQDGTCPTCTQVWPKPENDKRSMAERLAMGVVGFADLWGIEGISLP